MQTQPCFVLFLLASVPCANAGVLKVGGPGAGYPNIQSAVDAAADGDVILVRGNASSATVTGKSLSIVADDPALPSMLGNFVIAGVPAGGMVLVAGFTISSGMGAPLSVVDCTGAVRIQDFSLTSMNYLSSAVRPALEVRNCADVAVSSSMMQGANGVYFGVGYVYGGIEAASVQDSTVSFHGCTMHGGNGANGGSSSMGLPLSGTPGAAGLVTFGTSNVFLSGCTLIGGNGGNGINGGGPPPMCTTTTYSHPTGGGAGGPAVLHLMPATGNGFANSAVGGMGGMSGVDQCGSQPVQAQSGAAFQSNGQPWSETSGIARVLNAPRVVRESTSFVLHFAGVPGDHVYLASSQQPAHVPALSFDGVFLGQGPYRRTSMGTIGSTGTLDVTLPLGDLGPGVAEDLRHLQCVMLDASGHLHVGSSAVLTRLDSAY
jgi:hypothetical protein